MITLASHSISLTTRTIKLNRLLITSWGQKSTTIHVITQGIDGIDLANKPSNLATTSKTINSTKNSKNRHEVWRYFEDKASERLDNR